MTLNDEYSRDLFLGLNNELFDDVTYDFRKVESTSDDFLEVNLLGYSPITDVHLFEMVTRRNIEHKVTLTRNSFRVLKSIGVYNALVVFRTEGSSSWRLSLMTSQPTFAEGQLLTKISNPRRFSYLLGPGSKILTPTKMLLGKGKVSSLEELQSRFSIEVVNDAFFSSISELFDRLVGDNGGIPEMRYPGDKISRNQYAVRLIGRLVFCWFLKEKQDEKGSRLISDNYFSSSSIAGNENFLQSVINPLFFEVLNTPIEGRETSLPSEMLEAPFLNGGLFEPKEDEYYFGYRNKKNKVSIEDFWFKDLFTLFETYNFTVDENSSVEVDISIDPEMLGRIFENLLARIDPITGENVRSMTGSYYTPREIVDRMVDSSLIAHLHQRLDINEDSLRALFSHDLEDDEIYPLTPNEVKMVLELLGDIRVLDPACGSGAFPIGAMQRIVFALGRLDPDAQKWLEQQIAKLPSELRQSIKSQYSSQNLDYVRKLTVIRSSIFGIDIQPVAIEIAKLRCFLTLIVDQTVSSRKKNRGIQPLPNLDFKFIAADSLIPLVESANIFGGDLDVVDEVQEIRAQYFATENIRQKEVLKQSYVDLLVRQTGDFEGESRIGQLKTFHPFDAESTASFFDTEFFFGFSKFNVILGNPPYIDLKLMTRVMPEARKKINAIYDSATGSWDLFVIFIERSLNLLEKDGVVSMIVKNQLLESGYSKAIRRIMGKYRVDSIIDYSAVQVFKSAAVYPVVFQVTKTNQKAPVMIEVATPSLEDNEISLIEKDVFYSESNWGSFFTSKANRIFTEGFNDFKKLKDFPEISEICPASMPYEAYEYVPFLKESSDINGNVKKFRKLINTGTIDPLQTLWGERQTRYLKSSYLEPVILDKDVGAISPRRLDQAKSLKIVIAGMSKRIEAFLDLNGEYMAGIATVIVVASDNADSENFKYLAGVLNSTLVSRWFTSSFNVTMAGGFLSIKQDQIKQIPIAEGTKSQRIKMIELVTEIQLLSSKNEVERLDLFKRLDFLTEEIYALPSSDE
jgi:adenine-specific DNA-methyltransferase